MSVAPTSRSTGAVSASGGGAPGAASTERDSGVGAAIQAWPHVSFLELTALPTDVSCGRLHTRNVLWEWQLSHLSQDAEMLASELLTNAVKASWSSHGVGLIALRLLANRERLLIEVWDHHPGDPQPRRADYESESGRGFIVIEAMSHRWGFQRINPSLKVVWSELLVHADGCGR